MASLQSRISDLITALGADQKRMHGIVTVATTATLTPTGTSNQFNITAQAGALVIANPTAGMLDGQSLIIRIKDNGTARAISSWGNQYRAVGVTLPSTTVPNKTLYIGAKYNSADAKVDVIAIAWEA